MPWFKVDDAFHSHPKVLATSPAALGLWVVAGSWSSAHLTEGFVPDDVVQRLVPGSSQLASELVTAGLWKRRKYGYVFHDWLDQNPTKKEAIAAREKKASGGALGNHRRWHIDKAVDNPNCPFCQQKHRSDTPSLNRSDNRSLRESPVPSRPFTTSVRTKPQVIDPSPPKNDRRETINYEDLATRLHPLIGVTTAAYAKRVADTALAGANGSITNPVNYVLSSVAREPHRYRPANTTPHVRDLCRHGLVNCQEEECR